MADSQLTAEATCGQELWKPIADYPPYEISNRGRVRRLLKNGKAPCLIKTRDCSGYGHQNVTLWRDSKPKNLKVHRLVLAAFVEPCPPGMVCRHLDGNARNNLVENLAWGTLRDNGQDMIEHNHSQRGSRAVLSILTEENISEIFRLKAARLRYKEIADKFGVTPRTIKAVLNGQSWQHAAADLERVTMAVRRQRERDKRQEIIQHYYATGQRVCVTARALGISPSRVCSLVVRHRKSGVV